MRDSDLAWVHGAAACAAATPDAARSATATAIRGAGSRETQMVAAVRAALAERPREPFASLLPDEREPLALARLLRMNVDAIASALDADRDQVKLRLAAALQRLARSSVAV